MKLNSVKSIETAAEVFRNYQGSWTAARAAAHRDENGVLVIPKRAVEAIQGDGEPGLAISRKAG